MKKKPNKLKETKQKPACGFLFDYFKRYVLKKEIENDL